MATPEGKVKSWLKYQLDKLFPGHWDTWPRGGPFGKIGCPDVLICWNGVFIAIEVKSDEGEATLAQMAQLKKIQAAGGVAAVLKGKDINRLLAVHSAACRKAGLT